MVTVSITPSCQPHHGVKCIIKVLANVTVWERANFTGENTLGRETMFFFRVMWLQGRRSRVSVTAGAGLDLGKLLTKGAQDCSESSISKKTRKKTEACSSPHCCRCVDLVRRCCGIATGCDKTHWHGFAQESIGDVATLLLCGIALGGC